jgi:predicted GNAT superfamily acetyltransferase
MSLLPAVSSDKVVSPLAASIRIEANYQQEQAVKSLKEKNMKMNVALSESHALPVDSAARMQVSKQIEKGLSWRNETYRCAKCGNVTISPET